jgi:hypothetical protein
MSFITVCRVRLGAFEQEVDHGVATEGHPYKNAGRIIGVQAHL